jgi:hypothetical protein
MILLPPHAARRPARPACQAASDAPASAQHTPMTSPAGSGHQASLTRNQAGATPAWTRIRPASLPPARPMRPPASEPTTPITVASVTTSRRSCPVDMPASLSSPSSRRRSCPTNMKAPSTTQAATKLTIAALVPAVLRRPTIRFPPSLGSGSAWERAEPVSTAAWPPAASCTAASGPKAATASGTGSSRAASASLKNTAFSNHCGRTIPDTRYKRPPSGALTNIRWPSAADVPLLTTI